MKKFITSILCTLYLLSTQACFAVNNLYFVKNTRKETLQNLVQQGINKDKSFTLRKTNPYLALSNNGENYALVILQTSSNNVFYYFQSDKNNKIDKEIKKLLEQHNIIFEQSHNDMHIATFEKQAQKILTNTTNNYDFSEQQVQQQVSPTTSATRVRKPNNTVLQGYVGQVAKGSTFNAYLQSPINTQNASVGDLVTAVLTENWTYNGHLIASQGSIVTGNLTKARHATYGSVNGRVVINFDKVQTPEGKIYNLSTEAIDFTVTNEGKFENVMTETARMAILGALSGLLIGLLSSDTSTGVATAIGAGIGAGGAILKNTADKGIDAEIPTFTELEIKLTKPLNVVLSY